MKSPIIFRIFKDGQIQFVKQFIDKDQVVVGRTEANSSDIDIDLQSSEISPIHCLIERRGLNFYLCDLGSVQGTYKNSVQVLDEVLESGDEFQVGPFKIAFFVGVPKPVHATEKSNEIIIPPPKAPPTKPTPQPTKAATAETVSKSGWGAGTHSAVQPTEHENKTVEKVAEKTVVEKPIKAEKAPQKKEETKVAEVSATDATKVTPKTVVQHPAAKSENKPEIQGQNSNRSQPSVRAQQFLRRRKKKGAKTFAQPSHFQSIFQAVRPGQGGQIEILIAWHERILQTAHVPIGPTITAGAKARINLPLGTVFRNVNLIESRGGQPFVNIPTEAKAQVQRSDDRNAVKEASHRLQQNEVLFLTFSNGIQIAIRFAPRSGLVPLDSPLIFSSSEFTGILAALIIAVLTSLIVSVMSPKLKPPEEEVQRVAQVIFDKPPIQVIPTPKLPEPPPTTEPPPPPPKVDVKPVEPPKKITEDDKVQKAIAKGDPSKQEAIAQKQSNATSTAREVRSKDDKTKKKMFTSSKQGGAVKTGPTAGANAKSKEPDVSNTGLLSAFGSGGVRQKLDKAYSGSGELLGASEKATGTSGFNENRAGGDLGSKFKDTGAGGKGTATQGIAGVGTKGRGTGMGQFGEGAGFGTKEQTDIVMGGAEEEFIGTIDREAVRRAVRSQLNFFKACYEREYKKNTKLEGKVVISWEIHERGVAKNARIVRDKTTIGNRAVEECVRSRMETIRFPEPPAGTVAEVAGYPFVFSGMR